MISNPENLPALAGAAEWKNLEDDLARLVKCRWVALEPLKAATLDALNDRLSDSRLPPCHALHFIGHGDFDTRKGEGGLYFMNKEGRAERVRAEELGTILANRGLRLVVLSSCHGAHGAAADPFASVSQHLIRSGVAAVLAMRYSVADRFAVSFSHHFYRRLAAGDPVDTALAETRLALVAEKFSLEWGNPVLSLRASEGRIFDVPRRRLCWPPWVLPLALGLLVLVGTFLWIRNELESMAAVNPLIQPSKSAGKPAYSNPPECPSPAGLDMEFVLVEPDPVPGDGSGEALSIPAEPFCIGRYEVTEGQWVRLMGSRLSLKARSRLPAGHKSAEDADRFVEKLNREERAEIYGLPSKIQWRFAARAGSTERFSFGDDVADLWRYGNCLGDDGHEGPALVGSFRPNDFGLYDMQGNVWEWVSDTEPSKKPGEVPRRIRVGGSWGIQPDGCYVNREATSPPGSARDDYGFRIVRKPILPAESKRAAQGPPSNPQP